MLAFLYCYFSCFLSFFLPLFFYPFLYFPWLVFPFVFPFLFSFMSLPVSIFLFLIPFFLFFFPPFTFFLFSHHCGFSKWCTVFGQVETMCSVVETLEGSPASWHESGSTAGGQWMENRRLGQLPLLSWYARSCAMLYVGSLSKVTLQTLSQSSTPRSW